MSATDRRESGSDGQGMRAPRKVGGMVRNKDAIEKDSPNLKSMPLARK